MKQWILVTRLFKRGPKRFECPHRIFKRSLAIECTLLAKAWVDSVTSSETLPSVLPVHGFYFMAGQDLNHRPLCHKWRLNLRRRPKQDCAYFYPVISCCFLSSWMVFVWLLSIWTSSLGLHFTSTKRQLSSVRSAFAFIPYDGMGCKRNVSLIEAKTKDIDWMSFFS